MTRKQQPSSAQLDLMQPTLHSSAFCDTDAVATCTAATCTAATCIATISAEAASAAAQSAAATCIHAQPQHAQPQHAQQQYPLQQLDKVMATSMITKNRLGPIHFRVAILTPAVLCNDVWHQLTVATCRARQRILVHLSHLSGSRATVSQAFRNLCDRLTAIYLTWQNLSQEWPPATSYPRTPKS